jgi:hypothetical protein
MTGIGGRRARVKLSYDERMRRLRFGDLRKLAQDRCGSVLPDDDAGREYLKEILLPISLWPYEARRARGRIEIWGPSDKMFYEVKRWAPWMDDDEAQELIDDINLTPEWQRKPTARTLGQRLNLTYAERARLLLRTIAPCDMTETAMALMRKQKKRQRMRAVRQKQPRAEYLAASISQTRPWIAAGYNTRRTWERNGKPRVASVCQVKLLQTDHIPATEEGRRANAGLCGRVATPTPAGQTQTYAEFLTADEGAWLLDALCPSANRLAA